MRILLVCLMATAWLSSSFAGLQEDWQAVSQEFAEVNRAYMAKERELRMDGKGSPELEEKANAAQREFLKAVDEHPQLKDFAGKQKAIEERLGKAIREKDDRGREGAMMELRELKSAQMNAALEVPALRALKEKMESAQFTAQKALSESNPEAKELLAKRAALLGRMNAISAQIQAEKK